MSTYAIDAPADETPCTCGACDWTGTFDDLDAIGDCTLTPGDPSPAGRCPECDSLAYVDTPKVRAAERAEDLLASLAEMMRYVSQHIGDGYADAGVVAMRDKARAVIADILSEDGYLTREALDPHTDE